MVKSHPAAIGIGQHKGHHLTKYKPAGKRANAPKQASKKGRLGKRVKLIRQVVA